MKIIVFTAVKSFSIVVKCRNEMKNEPRHEKTGFCICENKDANQLRSNCAADQRLGFRYKDSTIPLLSKSESLNLLQSSLAVQPGMCRT